MIDGYGTHLPVLFACIASTDGPVIELGCGWYSTPLIHAATPNRQVLTLDKDKGWLDKFQYLASERHQIELVKDWSRPTLVPKLGAVLWSVCLVDCESHGERRDALAFVRPRCRYVILHDSEVPEFAPVMGQFRYRLDFKRMTPNTTVFSDYQPLDQIKELCGL